MPTTAEPSHANWLDHVEQTEGWLSLQEAEALYTIASEVTAGVILEVGSYRGRSAIAISAGAPERVPVYTIDPHDHLVESETLSFGPEDRAAFFRAMLRSGAYRNTRLINLSSEIIAPGWTDPIGFLWIDGDHTLEGVTRDWRCWRDHLLPGAVVAFDDAHDQNVGPYHLLQELVGSGELIHRKNIGKVRTLTRPSSA